MAELTMEVKDEEEAELLKAGLADEAVRAFVKISGALSRLPDQESRERVLKAACLIMNEPFSIDVPTRRYRR